MSDDLDELICYNCGHAAFEHVKEDDGGAVICFKHDAEGNSCHCDVGPDDVIIHALQARIKDLEVAHLVAVDLAEEAIAYVPPYFRDKWGMDGVLKAIKADKVYIVAKEKADAAEGKADETVGDKLSRGSVVGDDPLV